MNQEKNQKNRSPHHDGGGLLAQVQASVEILSPVPVGGKCREKDYERENKNLYRKSHYITQKEKSQLSESCQKMWNKISYNRYNGGEFADL